jgi:hypothetical protein
MLHLKVLYAIYQAGSCKVDVDCVNIILLVSQFGERHLLLWNSKYKASVPECMPVRAKELKL